jgi:thiamine biosynthesis protein ThiI
MKNPDCFLIHYSEIALKGKNRPFFEQKLQDNLRSALARFSGTKVEREHGRMIVWMKDGKRTEQIAEQIKKIFGIVYFSPAYFFKALPKDKKEAEKCLKEIAEKIIPDLKKSKKTTFGVVAKRSYKNFPLDSGQINSFFGSILGKKLGWKVQLKRPDVCFYIEINNGSIAVYFEKILGFGGLPSGGSGKVVSLVSSGFDSPVASFSLAKRGCDIVYVHFHSYPQTSMASMENVENIVKKLTEHQLRSKLYFVPLLDVQKEIALKANNDYMLLLYRRSMMRLACEVAKKENAKALVTGESVGQVASQTLENILVTDDASSLPVLRPLSGSNKEEIIDIAKKIGTYEISTLPYEDCCTLFVPAHPITKAHLEDVLKIEKEIKNLEKLEKAVLEAAEIKYFKQDS